MDLEFHQLDLRYEGLRKKHPGKERHLLGSLSELGQLMPIIVLAEAERYVVLDGYKRIRALRRLKQDTVRATCWELEEAEALLLERLMRTADAEGPLEQGWLLCELRDRFGLSLAELARRFDRTKSWVSRRLSLVEDLPEPIQDRVRAGKIVAYAAMKYLVPLARANAQDCLVLAEAISGRPPMSTRDVAELYAGWVGGSDKTRELVLSSPWVYLRAQHQQRAAPHDQSPGRQLLSDLDALGTIARRAHHRLVLGLAQHLMDAERKQLAMCSSQARADITALFERLVREGFDAG
ncbi:ParB N-terminal domain-containing protein [bacterium]|nr:ParB N-terminal domain-containing protein [bacterium]